MHYNGMADNQMGIVEVQGCFIAEISLETYKRLKEKHVSEKLKRFLDDEPEADKWFMAHKGSEKIGAFGIKRNGTLVGIFTAAREAGDQLLKLQEAMARKFCEPHIKTFQAECFAGIPEKFMLRNGYSLEAMYPWKDELAPNGWSKYELGEPSLCTMTKLM